MNKGEDIRSGLVGVMQSVTEAGRILDRPGYYRLPEDAAVGVIPDGEQYPRGGYLELTTYESADRFRDGQGEYEFMLYLMRQYQEGTSGAALVAAATAVKDALDTAFKPTVSGRPFPVTGAELKRVIVQIFDGSLPYDLGEVNLITIRLTIAYDKPS